MRSFALIALAPLAALALPGCGGGAAEGNVVTDFAADASRDSGRRGSADDAGTGTPGEDAADAADTGSPTPADDAGIEAGPSTTCAKPSDCPGNGQASAAVDCVQQTCTLSCKGENYDVDQAATNGCEVPDTPTNNHSQGTATDLGSEGACDAKPLKQAKGSLPSDKRTHDPAVPGFTANGSAPDWYQVVGTGAGAACYDDVYARLTVSGARGLACYELFVQSDKESHTCAADVNGTCEVSWAASAGGGYSNGSTIYFRVQKKDNCTGPENASYVIDYHL